MSSEVWLRRLGEGDSLNVRVMREGHAGESGHVSIDIPFITLTKYIRNDPEMRQAMVEALVNA